MSSDPLLQPYRLKHLTLKNRLMITSHEPAYPEDGMPKERYRAYHVERARARHRDDDDRRVGLGRPRQPAGVQQPPRLEGRDRRLDEGARRRVPRARLRGDDPAHPPRPPHPLGQGRLAAGRLARPRARGRAPRLPEEGRGLGHRPDHRGLCRRRRADAGGRARRHRAAGLRPPDGPILVAADQRARRALRRQPRQPAPLHLRHAEGDPRPRRRRLHRWHPLHRRRGAAGRPDQGRRAGDFPPPQGLRHGRLPQRGEGPYRHRRRADRRDPGAGHALGPAPRLRRRGPRRHQLPHLPRRQDPGRRDRALRHLQRQARHGRHDPRPHSRPAHRREDPARRGGAHPPLRRRQLLPRPHLPGRHGALPAQPLHRPRARAAARDRQGRGTAPRRDRRRRPRRARGRTRRCRARARGHSSTRPRTTLAVRSA